MFKWLKYEAANQFIKKENKAVAPVYDIIKSLLELLAK